MILLLYDICGSDTLPGAKCASILWILGVHRIMERADMHANKLQDNMIRAKAYTHIYVYIVKLYIHIVTCYTCITIQFYIYNVCCKSIAR